MNLSGGSTSSLLLFSYRNSGTAAQAPLLSDLAPSRCLLPSKSVHPSTTPPRRTSSVHYVWKLPLNRVYEHQGGYQRSRGKAEGCSRSTRGALPGVERLRPASSGTKAIPTNKGRETSSVSRSREAPSSASSSLSPSAVSCVFHDRAPFVSRFPASQSSPSSRTLGAALRNRDVEQPSRNRIPADHPGCRRVVARRFRGRWR